MDCVREQEVLDAVASGRLADLQPHLAECAVCAETAAVAAALRSEQDAAWDDTAIPTAQVVWFRAQIRARAEAARLAAHPITIVQGIGVACLIGAVAGVLGTIAWWLHSWAAWLTSAAAIVASAPSSLEMAGLAMRGVLLALGVWLVLAPVAVYLAATED